MAAIASHHARLVLFPFRLDADRSGYVDLPRSLSRRRLLLPLTEDAHRMREVNNAIFDDIFWVHLAYLSAPDGAENLRPLLRPHHQYAALATSRGWYRWARRRPLRSAALGRSSGTSRRSPRSRSLAVSLLR